LYTDHLLRNEFRIRVRCFAGHGDVGGEGPLGKPLVIPLPLNPIWVQRQQPAPFHEAGIDPRIADYFHLIDRVEIEFAYRQD
jgi:hypothetical protein